MTGELPKSLLHYTGLEKIGQGAYGEVFKATDSNSGELVAVKWLWPQVSKEASFWDEIVPVVKQLKEIKYEGIGRVYGIDEAEGRFIVAREFVEGHDIVHYVHDAALSLKSFLVVAQEIARSLKYAHDKGVIHANLKPSNIMVRPDGRVRLIDFAFSRSLTPDTVEGGVSPEDFRYLAPEQTRHDAICKATDLYSLGAVFFEALCGKPAYPEPTTAQVLTAIDASDPDFKELGAVGVSGDMVFLIEKLMSWKSKERFSSAGELLINLQAITEFERTHPAEGPLRQPKEHTPRRYLMVSIFVALLVIFWIIITTNY